MTAIQPLMIPSPPYLDLAVTGLPAGTARCRVVRTWAGVSEELTGGSRRPVVGTQWRVLDHSVPVSGDAAPVEYRIEPLTAGGAVIAAGVASITLPTTQVAHSQAWLSDPLDPLGATQVEVKVPGEDTWQGEGELLTPMGGLPVSTGFTRARSRDWRFKTSEFSQAAAAAVMIARGGVLLLRGDPSCLGHPTGVIHLHSDSPAMSSVRGFHDPVRNWSIPAVECAGPALLEAVAVRTYADDRDVHATYAASKAAFATYLLRSRGGAA